MSLKSHKTDSNNGIFMLWLSDRKVTESGTSNETKPPKKKKAATGALLFGL